MSPNAVATLAIILWPFAVAALFARMPLNKALIWSILGGYLLLPEAPSFNLPMLPTYGKALAASLAALVLCVLADRPGREPRSGWLPASGLGKALVLIYILQPFLTTFFNRDPVVLPNQVIPGLSPYDAGAFMYGQLTSLLPFMLARRYLGGDESQDTLLRAFVAAAVAYTVPAAIELQLSPQFNRWIYGFYQFEFAQQARGGGFRSVVFLNHGLWTALFFAMGAIAAAGLWRAAAGAARSRAMAAALWMLGFLAVNRSLGALLIAAALAPLARFGAQRLQMTAAVLIAAIVLTYPMLRSAGLVPTQAVAAAASIGGAQRVASLQYRFDNEDILLRKANERPLTGWGGWGRNRVYDPETGWDISTTDGRWVIVFGFYGWTGYIAEFGLLTLPVFLVALRRRRDALPDATVTLCLVLCANLIDMIPNGTLTPLTMLTAGAVLGRAEAAPRRAPAPVVAAARPKRRRAAIGVPAEGARLQSRETASEP